MPTVVFYQIPPEDAVIEVLTPMLADYGLTTELGGRGVSVPVIAGHPLFSEGISEGVADREFPKIGVEWTYDERQEFIGQGYEQFKPSNDFRERMQSYKNALQDKKRVSSDGILDALCGAKLVEKFHHRVESKVVIAGFASGGAGRRLARWMYEAVDSCLAPLLMDLQTLYPGISILTSNHHEVNLTTDEYGTRLWGFEVPISIVQFRTTIRSVPEYNSPDITGFDIHLVNSRTRFMGSFGLETYGQGNYQGHFKTS
jgi:hypothetical protein